jgi:hypothetical protein
MSGTDTPHVGYRHAACRHMIVDDLTRFSFLGNIGINFCTFLNVKMVVTQTITDWRLLFLFLFARAESANAINDAVPLAILTLSPCVKPVEYSSWKRISYSSPFSIEFLDAYMGVAPSIRNTWPRRRP